MDTGNIAVVNVPDTCLLELEDISETLWAIAKDSKLDLGTASDYSLTRTSQLWHKVSLTEHTKDFLLSIQKLNPIKRAKVHAILGITGYTGTSSNRKIIVNAETTASEDYFNWGDRDEPFSRYSQILELLEWKNEDFMEEETAFIEDWEARIEGKKAIRKLSQLAQQREQQLLDTPSSNLLSMCKDLLPPDKLKVLVDKHGGEDKITKLGLKLKPKVKWGTQAVGKFADIVGTLFDYILQNGKAGDPAAEDIFRAVVEGSKDNRWFHNKYKAVIAGGSTKPDKESLLKQVH
jgi:hypothetical protein